jgi:proteasome lid subunit RPN8/RPN11
LAELRAYGRALEAEVWNDYQAISLLELENQDKADVLVALLDDKGKPTGEIGDWRDQIIVLAPVARSGSENEPDEKGNQLDSPAKDTRAEESASVTAPEEASAEPAIAESADNAPEVETPGSEEPDAVTELPGGPPTIIQSQARVRVAGSRLPLAQSDGAAVDIFLDEAPLRAMQAHALSSLNREVAGVMVGQRPEKQPDGRYIVHVIDSIIAQHTVMQGASVTYTPESWRYLNDSLMERYPDESALMVGWYHTHPGFGIFLSGMDLFIHQNFFTQLWHVAYVLDPRARTSGFFCWNRQRTKVSRYNFEWPGWAAGTW